MRLRIVHGSRDRYLCCKAVLALIAKDSRDTGGDAFLNHLQRVSFRLAKINNCDVVNSGLTKPVSLPLEAASSLVIANVPFSKAKLPWASGKSLSLVNGIVFIFAAKYVLIVAAAERPVTVGTSLISTRSEASNAATASASMLEREQRPRSFNICGRSCSLQSNFFKNP
jgi:hypothetical protein